MLVVAILEDLEQLRFEIEQASKAIPPLENIFFQFTDYPIPMEFSIKAAKELVVLMQKEMKIKQKCMVALLEDKCSIITSVDTGRI